MLNGKNDKNEKKDLTKIIEERIKEYQSAIKYFNENNLEEKKPEALDLLKKLEGLLQKSKSPKSSNIDEKDIPNKITPEFIYGYSTDERIKKFLEIITVILKEKEKIQKEVQNITQGLFKLTSEQLKEKSEEIEKTFEGYKVQKLKYDSILNIIKEDFMDEWKPAPLIANSNSVSQVDKRNEEIEENTIIIKFGKTDYIKDKTNVVITAELPEIKGENGEKLIDQWMQKAPGDWDHSIKWTVDKDDYFKIFEKNLIFKVEEKKGSNKFKPKANGIVALRFLENKIFHKGKYVFQLVTKRMDPYIELEFNLRNSPKPEKETITIKHLHFTKFYPSFSIE